MCINFLHQLGLTEYIGLDMLSLLSGVGDGATEEELQQSIKEDLQLDEQTTTGKKKSDRRATSTPAVIPETPPEPGLFNTTSSSATLSNPPLDKSSSSEGLKSPSNASQRCLGIESFAEPDVTGSSEEVDLSNYSEEHRASSTGERGDTSMVICDDHFLGENLLKKSYDNPAKRRTC